MKTIIAGSRTATQSDVTKAINESGWIDQITEVVSGGNKIVWPDETITGADYWGEQFAIHRRLVIATFDANWHVNGRAAGPIRNQRMADYADALILVWDGASKGSADMLRRAKASGLQVFIYRFEVTNE